MFSHHRFREMDFDQKFIPPDSAKSHVKRAYKCLRARKSIRVSRREISAGACSPAENRKTVSSAGVTSIGRQCITGFTKVFAFEWSAGFRRTCSLDMQLLYICTNAYFVCARVRIFFSFLCRSFNFINSLPKRNYVKNLANICPNPNFFIMFLSYYSYIP